VFRRRDQRLGKSNFFQRSVALERLPTTDGLTHPTKKEIP